MTECASDRAPRYGHSDLWAGLAVLAVGVAAALMAFGFDARSRSYPLTLGIVMASLGLVLCARVAMGTGAHRTLAEPLKVALIGGAIIGGWIVMVSIGLGFLLPTLLLQVAFMLVCGLRAPVIIAGTALGVTAAAYILFILLLDVRLPVPISAIFL